MKRYRYGQSRLHCILDDEAIWLQSIFKSHIIKRNYYYTAAAVHSRC
jgi:hypothetical protein